MFSKKMYVITLIPIADTLPSLKDDLIPRYDPTHNLSKPKFEQTQAG